MPFVVEDGTGKIDANSYGDVDEADAYFTDRGITNWTGTTDEKQSYLIRATDYIDGRFGDRFIGTKKTEEQALAWPRNDAENIGDDIVPIKLQRACFEYALRAKTSALAPDLQIDPSGLSVVATRKKVGPIETEYAVSQTGLGSTPMLFRPYPAADMLLRGLVYSTNQVIR